jgi:hypothetical protein
MRRVNLLTMLPGPNSRSQMESLSNQTISIPSFLVYAMFASR